MREVPPAELLRECPSPAFGGPLTNSGLVGYVDDLRAALRACNDDKTALRDWAGQADLEAKR